MPSEKGKTYHKSELNAHQYNTKEQQERNAIQKQRMQTICNAMWIDMMIWYVFKDVAVLMCVSSNVYNVWFDELKCDASVYELVFWMFVYV